MDKPLVSVVTPIYNAERFLEQCLKSLAEQTFERIEFICIDDGSTDASPAILHRCTSGDPRFRVVRQENVGYGRTMNNGMRLARGEYVGFLDSDDFAEPDMIETLYAAAVQYGFPDIVKANYYAYSSKDGDRIKQNNPSSICGMRLSIADEQGQEVLQTKPTIWAAIYRLDFLRRNNLVLTEAPGAAYQDTAFVFKAWIAAESFVLLDMPFVHYRTDNPNSSVKAPGNVFRVCEEFDLIEVYARESAYAADLLPRITAKRFTTYEWNASRLRDGDREQFVMKSSEEFSVLRSSGMLVEEHYSKPQWKRLNMLIDRPIDYYAWLAYGRALKRTKKENSSQRAELAQIEQLCAQQQEDAAQQRKRADDFMLQAQHAEAELARIVAASEERALAFDAEIELQHDEVKRLEVELDKYRDRAAALEASNSYRIGRMCTWLPRRIKRALKRWRATRKDAQSLSG